VPARGRSAGSESLTVDRHPRRADEPHAWRSQWDRQ